MSRENSCGVWFYHPKWMNRFATTRWFLLIYGLLGTLQAMGLTYFSNTMTTLEKRFDISSNKMGLALCGNEIAQVLLSLILSYFGGRGNRPRWIAWGVLSSAVSCFILASPHLIYGAGDGALQLTEEKNDLDRVNLIDQNITEKIKWQNRLCNKLEPYNSCQRSSSQSNIPLTLIFLSQFVLGIGNTLYFSLGQSYLDDNVKTTKTAWMLGVALALRMLGPMFGFILGAFTLRIFIDPWKRPVITNDDPRWLGAWWLGWVVMGCILIFFSLLIGLFPKELKKRSVATLTTQPLTGFVQSFKLMMKNKCLIYNTLSMIFYILGSNGYLVFLSKYIEVQYHKSAKDATIITGPATLVGMAAGYLLSGYLISKFKPRTSYVLLWNVTMGIFTICGELFNLYFSCPDRALQQLSQQVSSECSSHCSCVTVPYTPICTRNGSLSYFSPCQAGCDSWSKEFQVYSNCRCTEGVILSQKYCFKDCDRSYYGFIIAAVIFNFLFATGRIGNTLVNYRCIVKENKSFAQGFVLMMTSLFAFIPTPIIFGKIIESTCLIWTQQCNSRGSCQLYDKKKFRLYFNGAAILFTFLGVAFDYLVWREGKTLDLYHEAKVVKSSDIEQKESEL